MTSDPEPNRDNEGPPHPTRTMRVLLWTPKHFKRSLTRRYGAGPLHLLALLASFAFAGYVIDRVNTVTDPLGIAAWFAVTVIAHDLFLFPLYALADRTLTLRARYHPERLPRVPWINHLRVPTIMTGTLLLVSFPLVFRLDRTDYHNATGLTPHPYLARWLAITAALYAASAIVYAIRIATATARLSATIDEEP